MGTSDSTWSALPQQLHLERGREHAHTRIRTHTHIPLGSHVVDFLSGVSSAAELKSAAGREHTTAN